MPTLKIFLLSICILYSFTSAAQLTIKTDKFNKKNGAKLQVHQNELLVQWPAGEKEGARLAINLDNEQPLFKSIQIGDPTGWAELASQLDPAFWLTISKRDLVSQNGWNIFFDKVHLKTHTSHKVELRKSSVEVSSEGARTVIRVGHVSAADFNGVIEITLYHGSALMNVAAVMSTAVDSTAIIYDAGLVSKFDLWSTISYVSVYDSLKSVPVMTNDTITHQDVKYRTIVGNSNRGSIAVFPAPHQYFYPLDEAFNLKFVWFGSHFKNQFEGYGIGIRQDLQGDRRFVPWFNAPPGTPQRLNFFCQLSAKGKEDVLAQVKKLTNGDRYPVLPGYKTMSSHFHNEFVVKVIMANKPLPDTPNFVKVFKATGVDMVHLGEFHYTAHPQGPDELRLLEMKYMFDMCRKYSDDAFLLMPGEEPNEFFGGHWLQLFPKPVYWIMSRKKDMPIVSDHPVYGKVYRIAGAAEMLQLLEKERGLAWTAHARTKGSTGYPDKYKNESFFTSDRFMGAAWKAMPADLSQDKLGNGRVLDLLDDMNNWGLRKKVIGEADLFTIEPENEMYAHLNVNYLQLDQLPKFEDGWQPVLDVLESGNFFTSTGEVLIPGFTVDDQPLGSPVKLKNASQTKIEFNIHWTFPLNFAEIISGDGTETFRHRVDLRHTGFYGKQTFRQTLDLRGKKWVRLEVWDAAVNGAYTQTLWLE